MSRNPPFQTNVINLLELDEIKKVSKNLNIKNTFNRDGVLIKKKNELEKIFIPDNLIKKLIDKAHKQYGHIGARKLINLISPYYISTNLHEQVAKIVSSCITCQKNKITNKKN